MAHQRLATGTGGDSYTQRMRSAAVRAQSGLIELQRCADRLSEELDDVTPVHGIPVTGYDEEDSLITTVDAMIAKAAASGT